jgi:hypothetical protein
MGSAGGRNRALSRRAGGSRWPGMALGAGATPKKGQQHGAGGGGDGFAADVL